MKTRFEEESPRLPDLLFSHMILRRVSTSPRLLNHAPRVRARDAPELRVRRLEEVRVDTARSIYTAQRVRREVEAQPAAERLAPEALALRVRLERPPRLAMAKTDVVAEPYVLAGVDAALRAVAREGACYCWRRWSCCREAGERGAEHAIVQSLLRRPRCLADGELGGMRLCSH